MHLIFPHPPPPSRQILQNLCFSFRLGFTAVQRETKNNAAYAKFCQIRCIMGDVHVAYSIYGEATPERGTLFSPKT